MNGNFNLWKYDINVNGFEGNGIKIKRGICNLTI